MTYRTELVLRTMLQMTLQILINSILYDLMLRTMLRMTLQSLMNSKLYDLLYTFLYTEYS